MNLQVFDICREGTHTLGPGNRYVIWTQGCLQNCKGCLTPESKPLDSGFSLDCENLAADIILSKQIDGITISGGEPFLQIEALTEILSIVKKFRPELTVIIYSGYTFSQIKSIPKATNLLALTDVIIDGPYIENLNDNKGIRGSSNQKINPVSSRLNDFIDTMDKGKRHQSKVMGFDFRLTKIGIPTN